MAIIDTDKDGLVEEVLTAEQQAALRPDTVLASLLEGNRRFVGGEVTVRNHKAQIRKAASAQFPKAIVLSCVDSRVPVEDVFDRGIGDLFVARVAGNFVNADMLGSMEFACKVAGAKLVLVLGHEHCGAVKSAIDDVKLGNITEMLSKITPAVAKVRAVGMEGTSQDPAFVHAVCEANVSGNVQRIREESPVLAALETEGAIAIVGAVYDMDDGSVTLLDRD